MIAGHFGFAAIVKSRAPSAPLWMLMAASVWLDVVFVPLLLNHMESLTPVRASGSSYGAYIINADYTHSLLGALALSLMFGAAAAIFYGLRTGLIGGLTALSHWPLDLIVHRGDLALAPPMFGIFPRFGFGLWSHPWASALAEFALVALGAWLLFRTAARSVAAAGKARTLAQISAAAIFLLGIAVLAADYSAPL